MKKIIEVQFLWGSGCALGFINVSNLFMESLLANTKN